MEMSRRLRTIFGVLTGLALISVAVLAIQGDGQSVPATTVVHSDSPACTGECATCPHAQSEGCPPGTVADGARVDPDKCIGCVRCVNIAPDAFEMNPETRKAEIVDGASAEDVARGAQACPASAITR